MQLPPRNGQCYPARCDSIEATPIFGALSRFEQEYEAHVTTMRETLLVMRNQVQSNGLTTTSFGQGDKSKVELSMRHLIKKHYPQARFWGFVDGIGWYVRQTDLLRMVEAYEDVFTFRDDEVMRFRLLLEKVMARS